MQQKIFTFQNENGKKSDEMIIVSECVEYGVIKKMRNENPPPPWCSREKRGEDTLSKKTTNG